MTRWTLVKRSLVFRARANAGVILGAAVGTTTLVGALLVGDSVRGTLVDRALSRLGPARHALYAPDRFFLADLKARLCEKIPSPGTRPAHPTRSDAAPAFSVCPLTVGLALPGLATRPDSSARANHVNVIGVETPAWGQMAGWAKLFPDAVDRKDLGRGRDPLASWEAGESAFMNEALAQQLGVKPGDEILVRVRKPSALALDAVITPKDQATVALRLRVGAILGPDMLGDFSLVAHQAPPANLFLPLEVLAGKTDLRGRANLLLSAADSLPVMEEALRERWTPEDAGLSVRVIETPVSAGGAGPARSFVEISSSHIFLEDSVVAASLAPEASFAQLATNRIRVLTYVANLISSGERSAPYSMVCAADRDLVPAGMRDDEIVVNQWLADDLSLKPGDTVHVAYYVADSASQLVERTNAFRVRAVVPLQGVYADRTLMPDFPGIAKAESTHDWDSGFPLVYPIREKDEAYWKANRGTPKAFVTLAAGQKMWGNRFGSLTAVRYEVPSGSARDMMRDAARNNLRTRLTPAAVGLQFEPVREMALRAASQSQDFGQLFLGFSIFLVVAALLLMALLFQFNLEQRAAETGTLLAMGFTPRIVRRLLLAEGAALAGIGGLLGVLGGTVFAKVMLWALTTVWRAAIGTTALVFHASLSSLLIGFGSALVISVLTIGLVLRRQARQPARELLSTAGGVEPSTAPVGPVTPSSVSLKLCVGSGVFALGLVAWAVASGQTASAGVFFGAGALLLLAGLAGCSAGLARAGRRGGQRFSSLPGFAFRGVARRRSRSLVTIALLASGSFVILSLGVFRLDADREASRPGSGTGGFALIGESTLPVVRDLNLAAGRDAAGLNARELTGVGIVPFRVRQGDDASCLNLNRAQRPRLLGVRPELLKGRFTFVAAAKGLDRREGWDLLRARLARPGPAMDAPAPDEIPAIGDAASIQWALGLKVGDALDYTDEQGRVFKLRLVGAVANSILQGSLVIDEAQFLKRFPGESGCRMFLVDAPSNSMARVSAELTRALTDTGLEITPATQRLNAFNAVQNTYLGTFQVLGGLGLLLGSAGLGVVVLRNVLERRAELAVLLAVGFRRRAVQRIVLIEHAALLALGILLGILAAALAVSPALLASSSAFPIRSLALTLAAVALNGLLCAWAATRWAAGGNLLAALRNE